MSASDQSAPLAFADNAYCPGAEPAQTIQFLDVASSEMDTSTTSRPATETSSAAASQPEGASAKAGNFPSIGGSYGLDEFISHFAPYEPMYFVAGGAPTVKFQFSLRYRILNPTGPLATDVPLLKGFNIAYSQTSIWDISNPSAPFFYDSSYRPEAFYYLESIPGLKLPESWQFGVQAGAGHESNGQLDPNHRSLNVAFVRPIATVGDSETGLFLTVAPKFYDYIGDLSLNPDMPKYRGYCDMRVVVGQLDGLQLATIARMGTAAKRLSAQFDLTYPLTKLSRGNMDVSPDAQYFTGYGDSLLTYNQRSSVVRLGIALVR